VNKQDEVTTGAVEVAKPEKKAWVRPVAHTTPAQNAASTGGGSGDGCCCHT
jgi:hypothetical protein